MNTLTQKEFDALSKAKQTEFQNSGGTINEIPEPIDAIETPSNNVVEDTIKGKNLFYITKKPNLLAYGARSGKQLKAAEEGGNAGLNYYQCFYKGVGFAVNENDPFIKDLDTRNLGEVILQRSADGYTLLGYVPKDALVAMTKDDLELDILKAKASFAKQAFKVENFQFNAKDINEMIALG